MTGLYIPARRPGRLRTELRVLAFLVAAVFASWLVWQSTTVVVERVEISIAGLAADLEGYTIVQVTDIHGRHISDRGTVIAAVKAAQPDIIVATGDFVDSSLSELPGMRPFIEALAAISPVYAVSGNHDHKAGWPAVAAFLRGCGVAVLENEHVTLRRGAGEIVLAGVSDPVTRRHDLLSAIPAGGTALVVLLAHSPILHQRLREGGDRDPGLPSLAAVSLTLTGHTHGGQIKLPLIGAMSNASGRPFPRSYVEGLSWEGHGWLYISRGLGYTILPFRFLSRPELTVVTLRAHTLRASVDRACAAAID